MARKRPYTNKLLVIDILASLFTSGYWLLVVGARELYMHTHK